MICELDDLSIYSSLTEDYPKNTLESRACAQYLKKCILRSAFDRPECSISTNLSKERYFSNWVPDNL